MKAYRKMVVWSLAIIFVLSLFLVPVAGSRVSPVQAAAGWTKNATNPVLTEGIASGAACVIYDSDNSIYKMWYTYDSSNLSEFDGLIDNILALSLGTLIDDIKNYDFRAIADNDAANLKTIIDYLAGLSVAQLEDLLAARRSIIRYATSDDGITWQYESDVLQGDSGEWDEYYVGAPSVIKNSTDDYEMWYTGRTMDPAALATLLDDLALLSSDNISTILGDIVDFNLEAFITHVRAARGDAYLVDLVQHLFDVISGAGVAIGHATSTDGIDWTKGTSNPVLQKGSSSAWDGHGVGAPSIVRNSVSDYEMWYEGYGIDYSALLQLLLAEDLSDVVAAVLSGLNVAIGHATSANGTDWTKDTSNPVLQKGSSGAWDGYGVGTPCVIRNNATDYEMWYTGTKIVPDTLLNFLGGTRWLGAALLNGRDRSIGHATSANGTNWRKDTSNPVLQKGTGDAWDKYGVSAPCVFKIGSTYKMWYTGSTSNPGTLVLGILNDTDLDVALSNTRVAIGYASYTPSPPELVSIAVTPTAPSIIAGGSQQFQATGTYSDNTTENMTDTVIWSSSSTSIASIETLGQANPGLATGNNPGAATITATKNGISGTVTLTVTAAELESIVVAPADPTITLDATEQFRAIGTYSDGSLVDMTASVNWTSDNTSVATVGLRTGLAVGVGEGQATITATAISDAGVHGSTTLTVTAAPLSAIEVTPADPSIVAGRTQQFTAIGTYGGSTANITYKVTWSSSDNSVAVINAAGLAIGYAPGTGNITATLGNVSGNTTLAVTAAVLESIVVTPINPTITFISGAPPTLQFSATGINSDSSVADYTNAATWSSSAPAVASIQTTGQADPGLATSAGAGTTTITATFGGVSGNSALTVLSDTVAPVVRLTSPSEGLITSSASLTVSGNVDDVNAATTIIVNDGAPVAVTLDGGGDFSRIVALNADPARPVSNTVLVRAVDGSGNIGTSSTIIVVVDVRKPAITITEPAEGLLTNNAVLTVTGNMTNATTATLVLNKVSVAVSAVGGGYTANVTLTEGTNIIVVSAYTTDHPGDSDYLGTSGVRRVTLDTTPPVVTIDSPVSGSIVSSAGIDVSGAVDDPSVETVNLTLNGGTPQTIRVVGGRFSQSVALAEGSNTITVAATDGAGNESEITSVTVGFDKTKPEVRTTAPANNLRTNTASQLVTGTVNDLSITAATLYINGESQMITVAPDGSFAKVVTLGAGANSIEVRAADAVGNTGSSGVVTVTLDSTAPVITIGLSDVTDSVTITVTSNEPLAAAPVVTVTGNISMTPVAVNQWAGVFRLGAGGTYTVTATGADSAGNPTTARASFSKQVVTIAEGETETVGTDTTTLQISTTANVTDATLSVTSTTQNPAANVGSPVEAKLGAGVFIEIVASPELRDNLEAIDIRVDYDEADIIAQGIDESSLRLYLWNTTTGQWEEVPGSGVNVSQNYIYGRVTHLSKYGGFGRAVPSRQPLYPESPSRPAPAVEPGVTDVSDVVTADGVFSEEVTAESEDGKVKLTIDKDTIGKTREGEPLSEIRVTEVEEPPALPADASRIGLTYDLGPDGATFDPLLTVTFTYDPDEIPTGVSEGDLVIAMWDEDVGGWVDLEDRNVDPVTHTITARASHFTPFSVLAYTRAAAFATRDLSITPAEADIGESVTISAVVTNTGDLAGSYEVILKIDDVAVATEEVTLAGGTSQKVTFTIAKDAAGDYTVNVDGLSGTFAVKAPAPPAAFSLSKLAVRPAEVGPEEAVTVTVSVANTGGTEGSYTAVLKINGVKEAEKTVTVAAGSSKVVTFSVTREEIGSYSVVVDDLSAGFTVAAPPAPEEIPEVEALPEEVPEAIAWWVWLIVGLAGTAAVGVIVWLALGWRGF